MKYEFSLPEIFDNPDSVTLHEEFRIIKLNFLLVLPKSVMYQKFFLL